MADYFVSRDSADSDLRIDSATLAQALSARWPTVRFIERDDAENTVRWAIPTSSGRELWGELQTTGQAVAMDADLYDAAEFAQWLRTQIPSRYGLIFWDEAFSHDVPLTESTTVAELTEPFLLAR